MLRKIHTITFSILFLGASTGVTFHFNVTKPTQCCSSKTEKHKNVSKEKSRVQQASIG